MIPMSGILVEKLIINTSFFTSVSKNVKVFFCLKNVLSQVKKKVSDWPQEKVIYSKVNQDKKMFFVIWHRRVLHSRVVILN